MFATLSRKRAAAPLTIDQRLAEADRIKRIAGSAASKAMRDLELSSVMNDEIAADIEQELDELYLRLSRAELESRGAYELSEALRAVLGND